MLIRELPNGSNELRVIGYDGAGYRAQLLADNDGKGGNSSKVRYPIVTLVLYFGMERWNRHRRLLECFKVPEELKPYINDYKVNVFEIAWLEPETVRKFRSDFREPLIKSKKCGIMGE